MTEHRTPYKAGTNTQALADPLPCGHPQAAVRCSNPDAAGDTTNWCGVCAEIAAVRREEREHCAMLADVFAAGANYGGHFEAEKAANHIAAAIREGAAIEYRREGCDRRTLVSKKKPGPHLCGYCETERKQA